MGLGAVSAFAEYLCKVGLFFNDSAIKTGSFNFYYVPVSTSREDCYLAVQAFERLILVEERLISFLDLKNLNRDLLLSIQIEGEFNPKAIG